MNAIEDYEKYYSDLSSEGILLELLAVLNGDELVEQVGLARAAAEGRVRLTALNRELEAFRFAAQLFQDAINKDYSAWGREEA